MSKKSPATKMITERFQMNRGVVVNREAGTISGVRICGPDSANGRKYRPKVFEGSEKKYDAAASHYSHGERNFKSLAAHVTETKNDADGFPRCTLQVIKSDPYAAKLMEMAETCPEKVGLSHVAECKSHFEGGIEIIDEIVKVESVDIVIDPATNPRGFAESTGARTVNKFKYSKFVEVMAPKIAAAFPAKEATAKILGMKRLSEMDGVGDMEVSEPTPDTTPDVSLGDALKTLVGSISDEFSAGNMTAEEAGAKVTAFFKAHAGESDKPAPDEAAAEEAKKKTAAAKPLTAEDVTKIVADQLAKHVKATTEAEKPKSGPKLPVKESKNAPAALPANDKDLVALLKVA